MPHVGASANGIDAFLDHLWLQNGLARATLAGYRRDLEGFATWLERDLTSASEADLHQYLADRLAAGCSPRTIRPVSLGGARLLPSSGGGGRSGRGPDRECQSAAAWQAIAGVPLGGGSRAAAGGARLRRPRRVPGPRHARAALRHGLARQRVGRSHGARCEPASRHGAGDRQGRQGTAGAGGRGRAGLGSPLSRHGTTRFAEWTRDRCPVSEQPGQGDDPADVLARHQALCCRGPASTERSRRIRCATPSPPISSITARISAPCSSCSAMRTYRRHRFILMWRGSV